MFSISAYQNNVAGGCGGVMCRIMKKHQRRSAASAKTAGVNLAGKPVVGFSCPADLRRLLSAERIVWLEPPSLPPCRDISLYFLSSNLMVAVGDNDNE
jgi:hypothetical protein